MKALTLTQPWATLVAIGAKRIETRSWSTSYRGPLAIHAAKGFPGEAKRVCESRLFCRVMGWPECPPQLTQEWLDDNARRIKALPLGCVVATAQMVHCLETSLIYTFVSPFTEQERAFGNYDPGRFGFLLEDVMRLADPIPAKGALGFWEWDKEA
jgi:hypothetical protein